MRFLLFFVSVLVSTRSAVDSRYFLFAMTKFSLGQCFVVTMLLYSFELPKTTNNDVMNCIKW